MFWRLKLVQVSFEDPVSVYRLMEGSRHETCHLSPESYERDAGTSDMSHQRKMSEIQSTGVTYIPRAWGSVEREMTMLRRPAKGRKRAGILSHVLRPISTTFRTEGVWEGGTRVVACLKKRMSVGKRQGSCPARPIPFWAVAQTISVIETETGVLGLVILLRVLSDASWVWRGWCKYVYRVSAGPGSEMSPGL